MFNAPKPKVLKPIPLFNASPKKPEGKPVADVPKFEGFDPHMTNEYKPDQPNDYATYTEERVARKKRERVTRELERQKRLAERERARLREEEMKRRPSLGSGASRPSLGRGGGGGRGKALTVPAWLAKKNSNKNTSTPARDQFSDAKPGRNVGAGERIMRNAGWLKGKGIGKNEDGIASALVHHKTSTGMGTIRSLSPPPKPKPASDGFAMPKKPTAGFKNPSNVVLLRNMVIPGEVDDALQSETQTECAKYGMVNKVLIYEVKTRCRPEEAVRIFVEFAAMGSAIKAFRDLRGRFFGGRQVSAVFYPMSRFKALDLAPGKNEPAF